MNSQLSATPRSEIRNSTAKPAGSDIRKYSQPNRTVTATVVPCHLAMNQPSIRFLTPRNSHSIDLANLRAIYGVFPVMCRVSGGELITSQYGSNLTTTEMSGKNLHIISPDCSTSRARSRSVGTAPAFLAAPMKTAVCLNPANGYKDFLEY